MFKLLSDELFFCDRSRVKFVFALRRRKIKTMTWLLDQDPKVWVVRYRTSGPGREKRYLSCCILKMMCVVSGVARET